MQDGFSALHCASQNGHFDVVNMLAEKGAHIDIPTTVYYCIHRSEFIRSFTFFVVVT